MVTVHKATGIDIDFIVTHAQRMLEFRLPSWRANEKDNMVKADIMHILKALASSDPNDIVLIAIDENDNRVGFMRLVMQKDYYTGELVAHVNDIVVAEEAEGKGVGKIMLQKADEWATLNNARWITLNVFEENTHARKVYEKAGYKIEWLKYLKEL